MIVGPSPRRGAFAAALALAGALGGCASGGFTDMTASVAASASGVFAPRPEAAATTIPIFVASTRPEDRRGSDPAGEGVAHYALTLVSVPPGHSAGVIETPSFGKATPRRHFVVAGGRGMSSQDFSNELASHISGRVGSNRDVLLYVHGFNTSLDEARFRLAQIVVDARFGGVPVLFTWPSKHNFLSYISDKEQASIARDALEKLMRDLAATPGVGRVHILAHSMGGWLAMEALRENAIAGQANLGGKLGEVMLASPDIDLGLFRQQMARLGSEARVTVFVSHDDRALALSSSLADHSKRVGALDPSKPQEAAALRELGVQVRDVSSFSDGLIGHSAYADTPSVVRSIGARLAEPRKEDAATVAGAENVGEPEPPVQPAAPIVAAPLDAPQESAAK